MFCGVNFIMRIQDTVMSHVYKTTKGYADFSHVWHEERLHYKCPTTNAKCCHNCYFIITENVINLSK